MPAFFRSFFTPALALLFCSCSSQLASQHEQRLHQSQAMDDLQIEIADLKHALNSHEVDLRILEEKIQNQQTAMNALQSQSKQSIKSLDSKDQIASLEKRLSSLEKMQEKIAVDLRQINNYAKEANLTLAQYKDKILECEQEIARHTQRLEEVAKLKGTLTSISKAMKQPAAETPAAGAKNYRVKAGDSLEKIARLHHCSVEKIKQINHLENDRIVIGQEIKLPSDE